MSNFRTDRNNNPTAFTTDIAKEAGLVLGKDYEQGDSFSVGDETFYTAKLLGDPIALTIKVLEKIGFYTNSGGQRWTYIGIPDFVWTDVSDKNQKEVIKFMYQHEGGTALLPLFS